MAKRRQRIGLRHFWYFLAASEHGSFRKAGAAIGVEQSTLNRAIRDLEDQMGASLFHRSTSGVELTFAGRKFVRRARRAVYYVSEAVCEAISADRIEVGRIRIGIFSSLASGFIADLLHIYARKYERVRIELIDGHPRDHISAIERQEIDIAFVTGTREWPGCQSVKLWTERVRRVGSAGRPAASA